MRSSSGRVLLMVIGGFAVVAISFFATMQILDYWLTPQDPNANVIHVVEATYGLPAGFHAAVRPAQFGEGRQCYGGAESTCDKAKASCFFAVDAAKIGDPATGCGKDFIAGWRCGSDPKVHRVFLPGEANGRSALLSCPAP